MENIIFAVLSLILLIPVFHVLPLPLNSKGKLVMIGAAAGVAFAGIAAANLYPLWEAVLLAGLLLCLALFFIGRKMEPFMSSNMNEETGQDVHRFIGTVHEKEEAASVEQKEENPVGKAEEGEFEEIPEIQWEEPDTDVNQEHIIEEQEQKEAELDWLPAVEALESDILEDRIETGEEENKEIAEEEPPIGDLSEIERLLEDDYIPALEEADLEPQAKMDEPAFFDLEEAIEAADEEIPADEIEAVSDVPILEEESSFLLEEISVEELADLDGTLEETTEKLEGDDSQEAISNKLDEGDSDYILELEYSLPEESDASGKLEVMEEILADTEFEMNPELNDDVGLKTSPEDAEMEPELLAADFLASETELDEAAEETGFIEPPEAGDLEPSEPEAEPAVSPEEPISEWQHQMFQTMVSHIQAVQKQMELNKFEQLVRSYMHPDLPDQQYYVFASFLMQQYIATNHSEKLHELIEELKGKLSRHPIILEELDFMESRYCK